MMLLAVDLGIYIPGLLVLGACFILSLYHIFLYIQYKERVIFIYSAYLYFLAVYIACYLSAYYYYPQSRDHFVYYAKESMNVAAIISYCLFLSEAVADIRKKFVILFKAFDITAIIAIAYSAFYLLAGAWGLNSYFIESVLPLIIRVMLLILAFIAVPLLFPSLNERFQVVIKWGAVIYLFIVLLIMLTYITPDEKLFGLHQMQIFFIGTFIDVIVFSIAMGYKVRSVFSKILEMRNKISQDLHDDIGATLSGIKVFSQLAKDRPDTGKEYLDKINTYSDEMLNKMGDIVWSVSTENDSFESIIAKLRNYVVNLTAAKNIQLRFAADTELHKRNPGMTLRRNIYLITKEAVNNAIKYSGCDSLQVGLQTHSKGIRLLIEDNGKGFDVDLQPDGNGLKNMRRRAAEINGIFSIQSAPGKGTNIQVLFNFT